MREIEYKLGHAHIIDVTTLSNAGKVIFGATVHLYDVGTDEEIRYQIVGEDEADVALAKISVTSPIARGLIGKSIDDEVVITIPEGTATYEIVAVEYC